MKQLIICSCSAPMDAECVYAQTFKHPFMDGIAADASMDDIYDTAEDFNELNIRIAERLLSADAESVAYVTLGGIGGETLRAIRSNSRFGEFRLTVLPAPSLADMAIAAAVEAGLITDASLRAERPASRLCDICDTSAIQVVTEINSRLAAGEVRLVLGEYYPDEYGIILAEPNASHGYSVKSMPLCQLDRQERYDALTVAILPPACDTELERHDAEALMRIMRRLRGRGGCPWDAEQTHESLRKNLIEEAYETLDAIDSGDVDAMCEELGDLLLQIAFHAVIEEERSGFTFRDVTTGIVNKLIYRHPHIFGDVKVNSSDDVLKNWELLKRKEKGQATVADAMGSVPRAFPALMRACKVQKKAADVGFDWDSAMPALGKVHEEVAEVEAAVASGVHADIEDEVGDLFFAAVNVARLLHADPELCLSAATDKFERRFALTEELIHKEHGGFDGMTLDEMDAYWDRAKAMLKCE